MNMVKGLAPVTGANIGQIPVKRTAAGGAIINALRGDDQPLYDRLLVAAGAYTKIEFFTTNQGGARSWPSTNLPEGRTMPGEMTFSVRGFGIRFMPTVANAGTSIPIGDVHLLSTALFTFYKTNNARYRERITGLGTGGGIWGVGQGAVVAPDYQMGIPSVNDRRNLKSSIPLQAGDNFHCALEFDGAGTAVEGVTFANPMLIEVTLYGVKAGLVDRN